MNKYLMKFLEQSIQKEFVSVVHNYDTLETIYSIPYNASLAKRPVKLQLIRALGLDYEDDFDDTDPDDIDRVAWYMLAEGTPVISISSKHIISRKGVMMTHYTLDFDGEVLFEKSYPSDKLTNTNLMLQLIRHCSAKIVEQEHVAQQYKMEKMFISTNMFMQHAKRGKM